MRGGPGRNSNLQPDRYERSALTIELRARRIATPQRSAWITFRMPCRAAHRMHQPPYPGFRPRHAGTCRRHSPRRTAYNVVIRAANCSPGRKSAAGSETQSAEGSRRNRRGIRANQQFQTAPNRTAEAGPHAEPVRGFLIVPPPPRLPCVRREVRFSLPDAANHREGHRLPPPHMIRKSGRIRWRKRSQPDSGRETRCCLTSVSCSAR